METFDFDAEITKANELLEIGAPTRAVTIDILIASLNRATVQSFNIHGLEIALACAWVHSTWVASTFSELLYTRPQSVIRDAKAFLMVGRIFFRENGINCNPRREVAIALRNRIARRGDDVDLSEVPATLGECRKEAASRLNRSLSTIERHELKFRNALLKWVTFNEQTGQFCRPRFYGDAIILSLNEQSGKKLG